MSNVRLWLLAALATLALPGLAVGQPGAAAAPTSDAPRPADSVAQALTELGDLLMKGRATRAEGQRLLGYYARSLEVAEPSAIYAIVKPEDFVATDDRGPIETKTAVEAYERAASLGDSGALWRLGDIYRDGVAVAKDLGRAVDCYEGAAAAGNSTGKLRWGEMLARGLGVGQDVARGRALVEEVAMQGNAEALIRLGDLYAGGDAGPVEAEAAIRAYETAATLGEARALLRLGDLYRDGVVVPADGDRALRYYHLATNPALGLLRVHSL